MRATAQSARAATISLLVSLGLIGPACAPKRNYDAAQNYRDCIHRLNLGSDGDPARCDPGEQLLLMPPDEAGVLRDRMPRDAARVTLRRATILRPNRHERARALRGYMDVERREAWRGLQEEGGWAALPEVGGIPRGWEEQAFAVYALLGDRHALRTWAARLPRAGQPWLCLLADGRTSSEWTACDVAHAPATPEATWALAPRYQPRTLEELSFVARSTHARELDADQLGSVDANVLPAAISSYCGAPVDVLASNVIDAAQYERAADRLQTAYGLRHAAFDLWISAAAYRARWGDRDQALADLDRAAEIALGVRRACLAPTWIVLGELDRAHAWLDTVERADVAAELRARADLQRAWVLAQRGELHDARRAAERAIAERWGAHTLEEAAFLHRCLWLATALRLRLENGARLPAAWSRLGISEISVRDWLRAAMADDAEQASIRMVSSVAASPAARPDAIYVVGGSLRDGDREVWLDRMFPLSADWAGWIYARAEAARWRNDAAVARAWERRGERLRALAGADASRRALLDRAMRPGMGRPLSLPMLE